MTILEFVFAFLVIFLVLWLHRKPVNFPPGPIGPSYLIVMFSKGLLHVKTAKMRSKYGSIMSVQMGLNGYGIILNDWKSIQEAIVNQPDIFAGRPVDFMMNKFFPHGIVNADGQLWKDMRRFSLHHLKDFGFGKNSMEAIVMVEVEKVLAFFESKKNCKIDTEVSDFLFLPILNILWGIVAGKQYAMDDARMQNFSALLQTFLEDFQKLAILNGFSGLRFLPNIWTRYSRMLKIQTEIDNFLREEINEHSKTYKEGEVRDFIDVYLTEIFKQTKSAKPNPAFEEKNLKIKSISKNICQPNEVADDAQSDIKCCGQISSRLHESTTNNGLSFSSIN